MSDDRAIVAVPPILPTNRASPSQTGVVFPLDYGEEEWVAFGLALGRMETADNWWLGDWYRQGQRGKYNRLKEAAVLTGRSRAVINKAAWVASNSVIRITGLPWHHHYEVADDPPDEQRQWLERAVEGEVDEKGRRRPWTIRQLKAARQAAKSRKRAAALIAAGQDVRVGDIASAEDIPSDAIDWIITDPPYPADFLEVFDLLGGLASRVLKPGGSLITMVGQSYLPAVVAKLGTHLTYHWTLAYLTPGGQAVQLWDRRVNTFWKPLLWYVKGEYTGQWVGDVTRSDVNDNDKRFHGWGQSESGMADIIERFTAPGDLILDPFSGGHTTGVVADVLGRRYIGREVNPALVSEDTDGAV